MEKIRVLFVCVHNSARIEPRVLNPYVVKVMVGNGRGSRSIKLRPRGIVNLIGSDPVWMDVERKGRASDRAFSGMNEERQPEDLQEEERGRLPDGRQPERGFGKKCGICCRDKKDHANAIDNRNEPHCLVGGEVPGAPVIRPQHLG